MRRHQSPKAEGAREYVDKRRKLLPGTMKEMAGAYGSSGAGYTVIDGAGHLPMVEKPEKFADVVTKFLS